MSYITGDDSTTEDETPTICDPSDSLITLLTAMQKSMSDTNRLLPDLKDHSHPSAMTFHAYQAYEASTPASEEANLIASEEVFTQA